MLKGKCGCDTSWIIRSIALVVSYVSIGVIGESNIFPTIIWDPRNPLFGCNSSNYVLRVPLKTKLFFACPSTDNRFFNDDGRYNYENMYFLGEDKAAFDSCNATNAKRRVLYCGANPKYRSQYVLVTDLTASSELSPFYEGKIYYYIGTGFRSLSRLDDTVGGSCNTTDSVGQYKLRLTLYVCRQGEVASGKCDVCRTKGCYLKDCGKCTTHQEDNYYSNETSGICYRLNKTTCTNQLLGTTTVETTFVNVGCPTTNKTITKAAVQSEASSGLKMLGLWLVIVGLCSLCIGVFGGVLGYRWYHERKCSKHKGNNKVTSQERRVGFVNKGFDKNLSEENGDIPSSPVYIDEKGQEPRYAEAV